MKLIDKYLLRSLFVPLAYLLVAFVMIYIIYDLFENLRDFIEGGTPFLEVVLFYAFLLPSVVIYIVPISLMLAVLYSLSHMTKNNELTAMRASGISLLRLMVPLLLVGLAASLVVGAINETVGPWSAWWTHQFVRAQKRRGDLSVHVAANLAFKNDVGRRIWMIGQFNKKTFQMETIQLTQQRPDGTDESRVQASQGRWLDGRWWFFEVITQAYDGDGNPIGLPKFELQREMTELSETPRDFVNEIKDPEYLSAVEILDFVRTRRGVSKATKARVMVDFHYRLAMPWTCLLVTLIGIPFGAQTGRKGAFMGILMCILLFFSFYVMVNVGLVLGKKQLMTPWLAGWFPDIFYLVLGSILVYRMR